LILNAKNGGLDLKQEDDKRFMRLLELTEDHFQTSDSAHDRGHALRVLFTAEMIAVKEGGDLTIIRPAALIHDIGCSPKHLGKDQDSEERTLVLGKDLLEKAGYDEKAIETILGIVEIHGYSRGITPETIEGKILQDADRLDAMGATGIARLFLVSGSTNRPVYDIDDPWAENRDLDDKAYGLDHFFTKLLKLKDGMHTATGKMMAEDKHRLLKDYIEALRKELG
jgi:uncharacterized protein